MKYIQSLIYQPIDEERPFQFIQSKIQDISDAHGEQLGFGFQTMKEHGYFWVVSKLEVSVLKFPKKGQKILLSTWLAKPKIASVDRFYEVYDESNQLLMQAKSKWAVVKSDLSGIVKLRDLQFVQSWSFWQEDSLDFESLSKLPNDLSKIQKRTSHKVDSSELDFNHHVNNTEYVKYLEMILDEKQIIDQYEIHYLESLYENDLISLEYKSNQEVVFLSGMNQSGHKIFEAWFHIVSIDSIF